MQQALQDLVCLALVIVVVRLRLIAHGGSLDREHPKVKGVLCFSDIAVLVVEGWQWNVEG